MSRARRQGLLLLVGWVLGALVTLLVILRVEADEPTPAPPPPPARLIYTAPHSYIHLARPLA